MFDFQDEDRIITSTMKNEDIDVENSLRPKSLDDYLGQEKAKEQLKNDTSCFKHCISNILLCRNKIFTNNRKYNIFQICKTRIFPINDSITYQFSCNIKSNK